MSLQVYDFGLKRGVQVYRVSGTRNDLDRVLSECYDLRVEFEEDPTVTYVRLNLWTVLLKIRIDSIAGEPND